MEGSKYGEGRETECERLVCACVVPPGNWMFNRKKKEKKRCHLNASVDVFFLSPAFSLSKSTAYI
jgi:hypothetical protein